MRILNSINKDDYIIFTSEYQKNKFLEITNQYKHLKNLKNLYKIYLPNPYDKIRQNHLKENDLVVFIQEYKRKNKDIYYRILDKFKKYKIQIIISNQFKTNCFINKFTNKYKNSENINIYFNLDNDKISDIYNNTKYLLYLSDDEGTGLSIYESLSNACIPICKKNIVFNELVGDSAYYLDDIYDDDLLIKQINNILESKYDINKFLLFKTKYKNKYSIDKIIIDYKDFFLKIYYDYILKKYGNNSNQSLNNCKKNYNDYKLKKYGNNCKKIFIIGNGKSAKKIIEYGFEKFIRLLKLNNFKIICMNKILKYFQKENIKNLPDYYVAGDVKVNIDIREFISNYTDKFEKCYIASKNCSSLSDHQKKELIILRDILTQKKNLQIIDHVSTGYKSLELAKDMNVDEIYIIGYDENYTFCDKHKQTNLNMDIIPKINDNYFFDYYVDKHETFSRVLSNRKTCLNIIINEINHKKKLFNLSDISLLQKSGGYLSFDNFISSMEKID